jgi:hypothetical protein
MKTLVFAYLSGLLASIPAFTMFNEVGASPFTNPEAVDTYSILNIVTYFALIWVVPAFGASIGAKIGGRGADFHYIYGRGISGQVAFSICFSLLIMVSPAVTGVVMGLSAPGQTVLFLMASQVGCTLGVGFLIALKNLKEIF